VEGVIKAHWAGVKLREHPLRFGTATFAQSIYSEECYRQSIPLLKVLNYTGVCEVEYLFDPRDGKYKLIEINARTWLWVGLAKSCGIDYAKMIYNHVNGIQVDFPTNYQTGVTWINPASDTIYALKSMVLGKLKPANYFKSLYKGNNINALFTDSDWKPGFAYLFNVITFLTQR
jgi:predicted ATP-grasp superfamily ATP-dependent carboligase